ncbi:MAG: peroxiredoxin family protein [Flavobacteriales bacterium]
MTKRSINGLLAILAFAVLAIGLFARPGPVVPSQDGAKKGSIRIGQKAPDFTLKSTDRDEEYSLSDFEGHFVLIEFWASWCQPCRKESPNLVKAYEKYHNATLEGGKGLRILSVSLDKNVKRWKKAIEEDGLKWDTHVSSLKGWKGEVVQKYGVEAIPRNFLVNPDGKIVAINLRGRDLHLKIDEYLKSF